MKKTALQPIFHKTRSEASYEKLMLDMMSKLVDETRTNNELIRKYFGDESTEKPRKRGSGSK